MKKALAWSLLWIGTALAFNVVVYFIYGSEAALQFLAAYLIEKSLSIDNLFVFLMIFSLYRVPEDDQHRVLRWGLIGALVMRAVIIAVGIELVQKFHWMFYVLGVFLIVTGVRFVFENEKKRDPSKSLGVRLLKKIMTVTSEFRGHHFFVREKGKWMATPLLVVLLTIELTDLVFAMDSIPAVLAVSPSPFIIYTSNIFAILGLRSLYFALASVMNLFHYIKYGLAFILAFVGAKMLMVDFYKIPIDLSLLVIGLILVSSIGASLLWPPRKKS